MPTAWPRCSAVQQSLRIPPPIARGALPPRPERKRKAISWPLEVAKPQPMLNALSPVSQYWCSDRWEWLRLTKKNKLLSCNTILRP
jgi:hypothetical protein